MNLLRKYALETQLVLTFLGTYGVGYTMGLASKQPAHFSMVSIFVAITVYMLLSKTKANFDNSTDKKKLKKRVCYSLLVSFLLALTTIVGYQLQNNGMTDGGVREKLLLYCVRCVWQLRYFPLLIFSFVQSKKWMKSMQVHR